MDKIVRALPVAVGLAAATVALASPTSASPSAAGAHQAGSDPQSQCTVIAARPGGDVAAPGTRREDRHDAVQQVLPTPVFVDVTC